MLRERVETHHLQNINDHKCASIITFCVSMICSFLKELFTIIFYNVTNSIEKFNVNQTYNGPSITLVGRDEFLKSTKDILFT